MTAAAAVPAVTLPGGVSMPMIGFGAWQLRGRAGRESMRAALAAGYRHIDTATMYGNEADVGQALMDMFSSRRRSIGPLAARLAQAYEAQFGRAPDARVLTSLRQWANHATRRGKDSEPLDLAALVRRWSAQASASEAGALEPLAPAVLRGAVPPAQAPGQDRAGPITGPRPGSARPAHRGAGATPHPGSGRRGPGCPARVDRSRPDPPPRRAPARRGPGHVPPRRGHPAPGPGAPRAHD